MKKSVLKYFTSASAASLFAGGGFVSLSKIDQGSSKLSGIFSSTDLSGFINSVFSFAIAIGAIAAVLRLAYAGYLYMGSADMWSSKGKAREVIGDVVFGLLLLLAIYLILNQINPDIVKLNALKNITPIPVQQSTAPATSAGGGGGDATLQQTPPPDCASNLSACP